MTKQSVFTTTVWEEGRVFAENDLAFAFPTNIPITPGHSLVSPKRVVETTDELTEAELIDIFSLIKETKRRLVEVFSAQGFNCAWNEGREFGQTISHLHFHIVPRYPRDDGITEFEPRKFLYRPGSREQSPAAELDQIAQLLRKGSKRPIREA